VRAPGWQTDRAVTNRWTRIAAALGLLAVAVVLGGCGGDDAADTAPVPQTEAVTTGQETTTDETTTLEEPTTTEPEGPPPPTRVTVRYRNGEVVGGVKRHRVAQGDRVILTVRADVEEEVHLHGYDLAADVAPGRPARIRFRATDTGRFVFELEYRHIPIGYIVVR
jgi:hypothetical protein